MLVLTCPRRTCDPEPPWCEETRLSFEPPDYFPIEAYMAFVAACPLFRWCGEGKGVCETTGFRLDFFDEPAGRSFGWVYSDKHRIIRRQWVCP